MPSAQRKRARAGRGAARAPWRPGGSDGDDCAVLVLVRGMSGGPPAALHAVPTGALYSTLLLLHVLCALVGFGAVGVTGIQAARVRRGPSVPGAAGVRRYFRPGVNWMGRALYGVPVCGFCLLAASDGAFRAGDGFVVAGLVLWATAAVVAEAVVWPVERRIQQALARRWEDDGDPRLDGDCRRASAAAALLGVVVVAATVLMIAKP